MTKKTKLVLSIACLAMALTAVVFWIVAYCGLFSLSQSQAVKYAEFYSIDLSPSWDESDIPLMLADGIKRVTSNESAPILNYFNFWKFDKQIARSLTSFHLGFAAVTALFLAGAIAFTVLLLKYKQIPNSTHAED